MWELVNIDPTTFNVFSDLTGNVIGALLVGTLGIVYPYLVCRVVKSGNRGIGLDSILAPPGSLLEAASRLCKGDSLLLLGGVTFILLIATFSHSMADIYLEFKTVEVGENQTYFLGWKPRGIPTYRMIGDRVSKVTTSKDSTARYLTDPAAPTEVAILVDQADMIAKGLSRFSFLPPTSLDISPLVMWPNEKARDFPGDLQVRCHRDPEEKNVYEIATAAYGTLHTDYRKNATALEEYIDTKMHTVNYSLSIPDCDYEEVTPYKTIEKTPSREGWRVLEKSPYGLWSLSSLANHSELDEYLPDWATSHMPLLLAVLDESNGYFDPYLQFTENETVLPASRGFSGWMGLDDEGSVTRLGGEDDWQYGRRVRDGMTFRVGHVRYVNGTHYRGKPHPGSIEFQVEYSVLTGPGATETSTGDIQYTLSSWSKSCPFEDPSTEEMSLILADDGQDIAGCVIDIVIDCDHRFPEDINLQSINDTTKLDVPWCLFWDFDVTLLAGNIKVDPYMLAAYAGIATRNGGLNDMFDHLNSRIALNSLAAAYVMTRELVPGTVAYEGVRASIGLGYVCFMILPLFFILPLLCFITRASPPVPQSTKDVLVLGRDEGDIIWHQAPGSVLKFGKKADGIHLGLVALQNHPGIERESEKAPEETSPSPSPNNSEPTMHDPSHSKTSGEQEPEQEMPIQTTSLDPSGLYLINV